jgi:hypothetical protein
MGPEDLLSQSEKREVLANDRRVHEQQEQARREQFGTFFSHGQAAANDTGGGRFGSLGSPYVIGSQPQVRYPAAGGHQADPCGTEPPLGVSVDAMFIEPSTVPVTSVEATGAPAGAAPSSNIAPPSDDGELGDAGAPFSAIGGELAPAETFPASGSTATVGSSPTNSERR